MTASLDPRLRTAAPSFGLLLMCAAAGLLLPDTFLPRRVTGDLDGLDPRAVACLGGVCILFASRLALRPPTRAAGAFVLVEAVLVAMSGSPGLLLPWGVAAAWSIAADLERFTPERSSRRPALRSIARGALVVPAVLFLLAAGIALRDGSGPVTGVLSSARSMGIVGAAAALAIGVAWGRGLARIVPAHGELAWSLWMLWPSVGAMGFTYLARDTADTWVATVLAVVTLATIATHALVMGQRARPTADTPGDPPAGPLASAAAAGPALAAFLIAAVLVASGIVDVART